MSAVMENPKGGCVLAGINSVLGAINRVCPIYHSGPGCCMQTTAADQVPFTPVALLAAWREVLDGFSVIDTFHRTVYPSKAESNLHGIDIPHYARTVCGSAVHSQPETTDFVVILLIPPVQILAGMYVKQVSYVHYIY